MSEKESKRYPIPGEDTRVTTEVKGSRFIASGHCAPTLAEAEAWIAKIRREFSDATHNCVAYRIGDDGVAGEWSTDDGEPRGTAGKPILSALQGSGLGDVAVVVTRYFGGTKLGTGGLVRAYGGAVRGLLDELPVVMKVPRMPLMLAVTYGDFERVKAFLADYEAELLDEDFATDVTFSLTMPLDQRDACQIALTELSLGKYELLDLS